MFDFSVTPIEIPVVILIYQNEGNTTYKAYSPLNGDSDDNYNENITVNSPNNNSNPNSNPNSNITPLQKFVEKVYNHINTYENNEALSSNVLREVHSRNIDIPIQNRGSVCYFSTYAHPYTSYNPIHHSSPVMFDAVQAQNYAEYNPTLLHYSCEHQFI